MPANALPSLTSILRNTADLDSQQITDAVADLTAESVDPSEKQAFLEALHEKGESIEEVTAFAQSFRDLALKPSAKVLSLAEGAIDFVGTGGDHANAFNISTGVCLILASGGVRVVKHGNRGATTASGTADMQEALGFKAGLAEDDFVSLLEKQNFAFFFAPQYHPAFKHIVPVRKTLAQAGKRTVFNILGPLINPAQPGYQVLGVYDKKWVQPLAAALTRLGRKRGVVIHGETFEGQAVDKAITAGLTTYAGVGELAGKTGTWSPEDFDLPRCDFAQLQGGKPAENAERLIQIIEGSETGGLLDTLCFNAGIGLWATAYSDSVKEGISTAREWVESGKTKQWLTQTQAFFASIN